MRKIAVLTFLTIDGVMQAPGGPTEDTSGGFEYGGWIAPYADEVLGRVMEEQMKEPFNLLPGRRTFEIFAAYWPEHASDWPGIDEAAKYVVSNTLTEHNWTNSIFIRGDVVGEIRKLKAQDGPDLQVYGSADLCQTLFRHDLVDELALKIFPITLGKGKRLFADGTLPAAFTLTDSVVSSAGVIIANYRRAGEVETGAL
jgi:dihydrofolate reductase